MRTLRLLSILAVLLLVTPATAQDSFKTGANAYNSGFFGSAARHWLDLAERGHGPAQYNIGRMHYYGQGVVRDRIEAYKWFLIAGENGVERSHAAARILGDRMTSREVAEATLRARDWNGRRSNRQ